MQDGSAQPFAATAAGGPIPGLVLEVMRPPYLMPMRYTGASHGPGIEYV